MPKEPPGLKPGAKKDATPHGVVVATTVQLLGVATFALMAGISKEVGRIMVIIMSGILIFWLLSHVTEVQKIVSKI